MTGWMTIGGWAAAHQVGPAGGENTWRTVCGRITTTRPVPAGRDTPRCHRCLEPRGQTHQRPVILGRHLARTGHTT